MDFSISDPVELADQSVDGTEWFEPETKKVPRDTRDTIFPPRALGTSTRRWTAKSVRLERDGDDLAVQADTLVAADIDAMRLHPVEDRGFSVKPLRVKPFRPTPEC
jgi:hypothetical protein